MMVPTEKMLAAGRKVMSFPGATPGRVFHAMWQARPKRNGQAARIKPIGNDRGDITCPQCDTTFEAIQ